MPRRLKPFLVFYCACSKIFGIIRQALSLRRWFVHRIVASLDDEGQKGGIVYYIER